MASIGYISTVLVLFMALLGVVVAPNKPITPGNQNIKVPCLTVDTCLLNPDNNLCLEWPSTAAGKTAELDCPHGPIGAKATRKCKGKGNGEWEKENFKKCNTSGIGNVGKGNSKIKKVKVTKRNVTETAKKLKNIFKSTSPKGKSKNHVVSAVEILEQMVTFKETLNETAEDIVDIIDAIMEVNDTVLAESGNATTRAVQVLDQLAANIVFDNAKKKELNSTNILLQAVNITKTNYRGLSFGVSDQGLSNNSENTKTSVKLPSSILNKTTQQTVRVGFIFFANNKLFQEKGEERNETTSQAVLSSSVYGVNTTNLPDSVVLKFPRAEKTRVTNKYCVFWDEQDRQWSNAGCSLCPKQSSSETVECCCNHLTSFAVLFSPEKGKRPSSDIHQQILSIISIVGCIISLICVILTFLTYLIFRHLRKTNQQPILMNLCIAIALLLIVFVAGINSTDNRLGCQIVAVLLHYLTLVTVLWMGIEAYNLYLQIVKVMAIYQRRFMLKAALVGWGAPIIIVVATVIAAAVESKDGTYYGSDFACILHNQRYSIVAWFVPILVILLFNLCIFICVIYNLRKTLVQADPTSKFKKQFWTALAIMCLLGLTWLFGALAISGARIAFEYLFCIFNSLQGFFIFFFHCIRIKEVRSQWSLFVSGLGFSHRDSDASRSRSKSTDSQQEHSGRYVNLKDWFARRQSDAPKHNPKEKKHDVVAKEGSIC